MSRSQWDDLDNWPEKVLRVLLGPPAPGFWSFWLKVALVLILLSALLTLLWQALGSPGL